MSLSMRGLSRVAGSALRNNVSKGQQTRSVGDLPCKTTPAVEEWSTHRENLEKYFVFTPKNLATIGATCVLFPYVVYNLIIADFNKKDDVYGRKRRDYM
ncbi:hypothetical protein BSKO_02322 [Bryopsis sp. KO-2023]|nr:hypothetical protein BSKO_02322 [Bryopsis sp. KO-2023]